MQVCTKIVNGKKISFEIKENCLYAVIGENSFDIGMLINGEYTNSSFYSSEYTLNKYFSEKGKNKYAEMIQVYGDTKETKSIDIVIDCFLKYVVSFNDYEFYTILDSIGEKEDRQNVVFSCENDSIELECNIETVENGIYISLETGINFL